jgi:hypothetical protein
MNRLALVIAFTLGTIGFAFAQAPAADDHSAHHQTQDAASAPQSEQTKPQSEQSPNGTTGGPPMRGMMQGGMTQGMMQMMQGMMRMMHQQAQAEQKQQARPQTMQDCSMMPRGGGTTADATTMQAMMQTQAMMQMTQGMMQMMQSQMQSGRGPH